MRITFKYINKQQEKGFALIDVMVAALILAVGIIAFVNLENVSIKRSQQINFRLQATQSAASLIEMLRSDRAMIGWLTNDTEGNKGNFVVESASASPYTPACKKDGATDNTESGLSTVSLGNSESWCLAGGKNISKDLFNAAKSNFSENFQSVAGKAVMCLRSPDVTEIPTQIRIVVIWKNAVGGNFTAADASKDCPDNYEQPIPNIANVDATKSDIGYFEIFTRI